MFDGIVTEYDTGEDHYIDVLSDENDPEDNCVSFTLKGSEKDHMQKLLEECEHFSIERIKTDGTYLIRMKFSKEGRKTQNV